MKVKNIGFPNVLLLFLIVVHLALLTNIKFLPYPELFIYPYLTSEGLLPYKQIFDQHFPGVMFFPVNLYSLGINTPQAMFFLHSVLIGVNHILIFFSAMKFIKGKYIALLPNLLYMLWQPFFEGYAFWIDSFMPIFLISSLLVLTSSKKYKFHLAGFLMGAALVFKQVMLPIIIIVAVYFFFVSKDRKNAVSFAILSSIPALLMLLYIVKIGVWEDFYYWTYEFNMTTFSRMGRKLPTAGLLIKSIPVFGFSVLYGMYLLFVKNSEKFKYLSLFLLLSLFFAYARFDYVHLQPALPFAVIVLGLLYEKISGRFKAIYMAIAVASVLLFALPFFKAWWGRGVLFFGKFEQKLVQTVNKHRKTASSPVLALATTPHLNYLTQTLPPGERFVFHFSWFMVEAEEKILEGIVNDRPEVVVRDRTSSVQGMNLMSYMGKIDEYVNQNYEIVDKIGDTEILVDK